MNDIQRAISYIENEIRIMENYAIDQGCVDVYKTAISTMQELQQYLELEEQGRLLKLPCAVGDTVYTNLSATGWYLRKKNRPYALKIVFIGINGADNLMNVTYENGNMTQFLFSEIGKTVFLTREAAEKALEGMKNDGYRKNDT